MDYVNAVLLVVVIGLISWGLMRQTDGGYAASCRHENLTSLVTITNAAIASLRDELLEEGTPIAPSEEKYAEAHGIITTPPGALVRIERQGRDAWHDIHNRLADLDDIKAALKPKPAPRKGKKAVK